MLRAVDGGCCGRLHGGVRSLLLPLMQENAALTQLY